MTQVQTAIASYFCSFYVAHRYQCIEPLESLWSHFITESRPLKSVARENWGTHVALRAQ